MRQSSKTSGFLILEVIIASLIITATIAATMYLFRMNFEYLSKSDKYDAIYSKIPDALNYLQNVNFQNVQSGNESLGNDVALKWTSSLLDKRIPLVYNGMQVLPSNFELYLYNVHFTISYKNYSSEYDLHVFKYKKTQENSPYSR
ncbi:MAG: hypothetical protein QXP36_07125 [Conexivisphaerales archaeon]